MSLLPLLLPAALAGPGLHLELGTDVADTVGAVELGAWTAPRSVVVHAAAGALRFPGGVGVIAEAGVDAGPWVDDLRPFVAVDAVGATAEGLRPGVRVGAGVQLHALGDELRLRLSWLRIGRWDGVSASLLLPL